MEFILFLLILSLSSIPVFGFTLTEFVYPNFTASNFQFVDSTGSFLVSRNGTFKASIFNPGPEQVNFYLCVIHAESNTLIWSANGDAPISTSGIMRLTKNGISITEKDGSFKWSTPPLKLAVYAMQLTETGNLLLLDQFNGTLWQSFDHPTDTIVIGQKLHVGMMLSSAIAGDDLSKGRYRLSLTASDAMLQWQGLTYWKLSMETKAYTNSNYAVEYMSVNQTGLYLFGQGGSVVVIMVNLLQSTFRIAKLDASGQLIIISFVGSDIKRDFVGPVDGCRVPYVCGGLGVCTSDVLSGNPKCSCPANFNLGSHDSSSCVPSDSSYSLPVSCNSTNHSNLSNSSSMSYIGLGFGMDYFTTDFTKPFRDGVNLSICQNLCSVDCSCLGIFYANLSGSCYKLEDEIGSIMLRTSRNDDLLGFVKTLVGVSTTLGNNDNFDQEATDFPLVAIVILPFTGIFLLMALGFILWRRSRPQRMGKIESKKSQPSSPFSEDLDAFSIPGLPVRFEYKQLKVATDNFKTQIGTGGFGAVYKGVLPDNTLVAVKKIINLGIQGQRDFCTEIAIIGNIHHINLVKLKGFCAQERQRLLVYEYMNRGSLDRTLFGHVPVLEWQERVEIALGSARGLAYLHSGCEQKIVHCDVKPENILLHDNFQVKISDFGLSKLLNREESSLFTTMRGTRGYLAPEWLTSSAISDKTDVYSFGMVLLEIVSGRKNCSLRTQSHSLDDSATGDHSSSSSAQGLVYFPLFALEMHEQGRYLELADPKLEGRVSGGDIEKFVRVALCCVHEEPCLRPTMVSVVSMLEGEIPPTAPRMESLNFLRFYGRRFSEASNMEEAGGQIDAMLYPQLAKISFLKNERTFLRKIVEMILALALEGTISKMEILSAYLCKIYWGHGIFGIQSASKLYFGKHVSLLSLGECAMLAAMIPAPELRSPFRDSSRGKTFQARVLRRMVEFGFLDVEMASIAVKQHLRFNSGSPDHPDGSLVISFFSKEHSSTNTECDGDLFSTIKRVWDWETESKIWEVKEDMDRWATGIKRLESIDDSKFKSKLLFIIRLLLPKVH